MIRLKVEVDIRRRGDIAGVERSLRELLGPDASGNAAPRRRGGGAQFTVDYPDATAYEILASARAMRDTIAGNRWWIDVADGFRLSVWLDGAKLYGFVQEDFRGWFRDEALLDLEEANR